MDEPLSNLDAKLREEARAWLRELILAWADIAIDTCTRADQLRREMERLYAA